jgi:hypothetical protein
MEKESRKKMLMFSIDQGPSLDWVKCVMSISHVKVGTRNVSDVKPEMLDISN